jgi:acyl-CoA dehydrogenase
MERTLFREEHVHFRSTVKQFIAREVSPHQERWRAEGMVDREAWRKAGEAGILCPWLDPQYGGAGGDFLHSVVVMEEIAKAHESGFALALHSDIVVPYMAEFGTEDQKRRHPL